jgi:hypothetical protein
VTKRFIIVENSFIIVFPSFEPEVVYFLPQIAHGLFAPPIFCKQDQQRLSLHLLH